MLVVRHASMATQRKKLGACALCERERELTFHHLIPRTLHANKWFRKNFERQDMLMRGIDVCRDCHRMIHRTHGEKELGRTFNTKEALLADPQIAKFVVWVKKR